MGERELRVAELIREKCIEAARKGFRDASMSGLCAEGAVETAISAMQKLNLDKILDKSGSK